MYIPGMEEEKQIKSSIKEYQDDMSVGFDKIRLQLYEYTYRIAYPVFRTEENSRHVAEHILKRLEQRIDEVDNDSDFYPWYAKFCCYRIYRILSNRQGGIYHKDKHGRTYQYHNISEDTELKSAAMNYLEEHEMQTDDSEEEYIPQSESHSHKKGRTDHSKHLHGPQRLLLEMYAGLELDVEEIADLCDAKKSEISGALAGIRAVLLGKNVEKEEPGFIDLLFPKLSKKTRLIIDLAASAVLVIIFVAIYLL